MQHTAIAQKANLSMSTLEEAFSKQFITHSLLPPRPDSVYLKFVRDIERHFM